VQWLGKSLITTSASDSDISGVTARYLDDEQWRTPSQTSDDDTELERE